MTKIKLYTLTTITVGLASLGLVLSACTGGDTDGGPAGDETFDGTTFVGDDDSAGAMELDIVNDDLNVGETSGFRVHVRDADGAGVPGIEIACDTESGLALVEPNTGFELTDSNGQISGVVGCEQPGSYQIGCRLPVGGNQRRFETVRCTGPVPEGFTGFPGAGGGSLGTGDTPSGGTDNTGTVRITAIAAIDTSGSAGGTSIDVDRGSCGRTDTNGDDDTTDACDLAIEPFFDTQIKVSILNDSTESIFVNSFQYSISDADSLGNLTSDILSFSSSGEIAPGASGDFTGLFLRIVASTDQCSAIGLDEGKRFTGRQTRIDASLGFKNVTFRVFGVTGSGADITLTGRTGLSFGDFDNC